MRWRLVSVILAGSLSKRIGGFVSYTLSRSVRHVGRESFDSAFDRRHVLNAAAAVDLGRGWKLGGPCRRDHELARARPQRRHTRELHGAGEFARAADDEHAAALFFVGIVGDGRQRPVAQRALVQRRPARAAHGLAAAGTSGAAVTGAPACASGATKFTRSRTNSSFALSYR